MTEFEIEELQTLEAETDDTPAHGADNWTDGCWHTVCIFTKSFAQ